MSEEDIYINLNTITGENLYNLIRKNMIFSEVMELYIKLKNEIEGN